MVTVPDTLDTQKKFETYNEVNVEFATRAPKPAEPS